MKNSEIQLATTPYGKTKGVNYDLVVLPWGRQNPIICIYLI